jgi:hypothetical protein
MMTSIRISRAGWAVVLGLVLGLAGCGSSSSDSATTAHTKKKAVHNSQQSLDPANRSPQDMVAAVSGGKGGPPMELKFELREAPEAGQVVDVDIAVVADSPAIDRIYGQFQAGNGLELVDGSDLPLVEKPAAGSVIRHVVQILPKEDGIYAINATISVDLANASVSRRYSIPVIVGGGLPDETTKAEVADGQAAAPGTGVKTR